MKRHTLILFCQGAALSGVLALAGAGRAEEFNVKPLELSDEVACRVNTESISNRQIEDNMGEVVQKLADLKRALEANGQWDERGQQDYYKRYNLAYREALRRVVRQRLMLQSAKADQFVKVDEASL